VTVYTSWERVVYPARKRKKEMKIKVMKKIRKKQIKILLEKKIHKKEQ
jgi:hypothetical protein